MRSWSTPKSRGGHPDPGAAPAQYRRWDSNPHSLNGKRILNPSRLPIPPLRRWGRGTAVPLAANDPIQQGIGQSWSGHRYTLLHDLQSQATWNHIWCRGRLDGQRDRSWPGRLPGPRCRGRIHVASCCEHASCRFLGHGARHGFPRSVSSFAAFLRAPCPGHS